LEPAGASPLPPAAHPVIAAMWEKSNACRKECGLPPQRLSLKLCEAAADHAAHMARIRRISHFGIGNGTPWSRAAQRNFSGNVREIIAGDFETVDRAFSAWRCSRGHWAAVVSDEAECGFASAVDSCGSRYWVAIYGTDG
jgi:uncharacterized protein YkwD